MRLPINKYAYFKYSVYAYERPLPTGAASSADAFHRMIESSKVIGDTFLVFR